MKNCLKWCLNELSLEKIRLQHDQVEHFYRSQWQSAESSVLYLIYRWILALFFVCVSIVALVLEFSGGKFFIFLTNWGILMCMATNLLAAILVTRWHFNVGGVRESDSVEVDEKMPTAVKLYWLMHVITMPLSFVITLVYWTAIYDPSEPRLYPFLSNSKHGVNSVLMLVDFLVVGFPMRIAHFIWATTLPTCYFFFSLVYFLCGGTDEDDRPYIYKIMDWTQPERCFTTMLDVACLYLILTLIFFVIYNLKRLIYRVLSSDKHSMDGMD